MLGLFSFLLSCTSDSASIQENQIANDNLKNYKQIAQIIVGTALVNQEFREMLRAECGKEKYGDYFVKLTEILTLNKNNYFWNQDTNKILFSALQSIEKNTWRSVILFIPSVETEQDNLITILQLESAEIHAVFMDEYSDLTLTCPGYLMTNGSLSFNQVIDEEYAWENDVWVFGQEEVVSEDNMIANNSSLSFIADFQDPNNSGDISASGDITGGGGFYSSNTGGGSSIPRFRTEGREEWGGIIQITDLGAVEPWIHGKLELKYFVFISGTSNVKERGWGKRKRKNFRDSKWADFNDNIGPWNTPNLGNVLVEAWIEEDGGSSSTISHTFPSQCTGCPATTISTTIKDGDDNLGRSFVQFSDQIGRVYGITHANFKRK